jgi:hypothetical protein
MVEKNTQSKVRSAGKVVKTFEVKTLIFWIFYSQIKQKSTNDDNGTSFAIIAR